MSNVATEYEAIVTRWTANCPVVAARRCFVDLGGPPFDRPPIPSKASLTAANRETVLGAVVWIWLQINGVPGSARPQGIDSASRQRRLGVITQSIYYPKGFGVDFVLSKIDLARAVFHRVPLSSGLIQCRDSDGPDWIETEQDAKAGWARADVMTPYWVTEVVS